MVQVQLRHPHTYLVISVLPPCLQLRHQWLVVHYGLPYHCELLISDRERLKKSHIYQKLQSSFMNIKLCHRARLTFLLKETFSKCLSSECYT